MAANKVNVTINSRMYTVVSSESEEYIKSLGDYINEKINTVLRDGKNVIGERPLVLAALNICDEYFKLIESGSALSDQARDADARVNLMRDELNKRIEKNKQMNDEISRLNNELKAASEANRAIKTENEGHKKEINSLKDEITSVLKENRRLNGMIKK